MIYLYLFGTCFHFIYVFMIIEYKKIKIEIDKEMPSTGKPCRVYGF